MAKVNYNLWAGREEEVKQKIAEYEAVLTSGNIPPAFSRGDIAEILTELYKILNRIKEK